MKQSMHELIQNAESIEELQQRLVDAGYQIRVDGILGPKTKWAQADYERRLAEQPLPPKPWLQSRRMIGLAATVIGTVMGFAGYVVDHGALVELLTAIVTVAGLITSFIGSIKATRPIDTRAIGFGPRIPDRVRDADELPPRPLPPTRRDHHKPSKPDVNGYLGHFGNH